MKEMRTSSVVSEQYISFSPLFIKCDSSIIYADHATLIADTTGSFGNFTDEVRLSILLQESLINTTDLQYFLPFIKDPGESLRLSGRVTGKISELRGRDIKVTYGKSSLLDCGFDFSGLPDISDAFIFLGVNSLITNAEDLRTLSSISREEITVPEFVDNLGVISFDGNFTGFTTDFVTYGKIGTSVGNIRTDISLRPEGRNGLRFRGLVTGSNIDLGVLSGNSDLFGKSSMSADVDGYLTSPREFAGNLSGRIDSIEINRYSYRNVTLNGSFTEKMWDGSINVTDKNIKLDLLGMFSLREGLPEFDFTLNLAEADLFNLNFDRKDSTSFASALVTANFSGNSIDNLNGEIKILNSTLRKHGNQLELYDFSIRAFKEGENPAIRLRTDFLNADIKGHYSFTEIGNLMKHTLSKLMPSMFSPPPNGKYLINNNFTFTIDFRNSDRINNFFRTGILIADKSQIRGAVMGDSLIKIEGTSSMLEIKNNVFRDLVVEAGTSGNMFNADLKSTSLTLPFQSELKDLTLDFNTRPDTFNFVINWDNREKVLNKGRFHAFGSVSKADREQRKPVLKINIEPSEIYSVDNLWKINRSEIVIDSNAVKVNNLYINN
ncbi:MAG TPA: hypothetical protein VK861_10525, partial [Bacteroidales bacterium]|nr:hypothetical protein [Bacteroidales bacterium]